IRTRRGRSRNHQRRSPPRGGISADVGDSAHVRASLLAAAEAPRPARRRAGASAGHRAFMTFEHVIYIPGVLLIGLALGYVMGARAVRAEVERMRKRAKE